MKTFFFALFLTGFTGLLHAQSFTLTVQNGYGGGTYLAGDTAHIWSKAIPADSVFSEWTGDVASLSRPQEWHTTLVMPAQNVTVSAGFRYCGSILFTQESIQCRDTLKEVFSYFPPSPKGLVFLFHGSGGDGDNWMRTIENWQLAKDLAADTFAVIVPEAEEVTKGRDLNGDTKIAWIVNPAEVDSIDFDNISVLLDTFTARGNVNAAMPVYTVGMSNGGAFSFMCSWLKNFDAGVSYCSQGAQAVANNSTVPFQWCMALHDDHEEVGATGNQNALDNSNTLASHGVCTRYFLQDRSPVYRQRFMRDADVSAARSDSLYNDLAQNNLLDPQGYMLVSSDSLIDLIIASPFSYPGFVGLPISDRLQAFAQIDAMRAGHQFFSDYNRLTLDWLNDLCDSPASIDKPESVPGVQAFPIPVERELVIQTDWRWTQAQVCTLAGQVLYQAAFAASLDLQEVPAGVYLLQLRDGEGRVWNGKIVK